MPIFCYRTPGGEVVEELFRIGEAPDEILIGDGQTAKRCFQSEHSPRNAGYSGWPLVCFASGVHPNQAGELRKYLADRGCPTEVNRDGDPVYRDAAHRRQALRLRGMHDNNSFD